MPHPWQHSKRYIDYKKNSNFKNCDEIVHCDESDRARKNVN